MTDPFFFLVSGDNRRTLRALADESVDAVVTDPPYGLGKEPDMGDVLAHWLNGDDYTASGSGFMGKTWDSFVPGPATWKEVYRVLKPGGHVLMFSGTRTWDIATLALRLAGFEIRDTLAWLYGSGFPKSMDVSKAIDKAAGAERTEVIGVKAGHENFVDRDGYKSVKGDGAWSGKGGFERPWMHDEEKSRNYHLRTAPATTEAERWSGWGTALKPAFEPIVLARKPIKGTVAQNVLTHGTGALNIDGTRISTTDNLGGGAEAQTRPDQKGNEGWTRPWMENPDAQAAHAERVRANVQKAEALGRWPANVILSHTEDCELTEVVGREVATEVWNCVDDCPVKLLDGQSGVQKSGVAIQRNGGGQAIFGGIADGENTVGSRPDVGYGDKGGASRFFYNAKVAKKERNAGLPDGVVNDHPTAKPVGLMAYLVRLVTPPGGTVLDPFAGAGSTGIAAKREGMAFIGCELDPHYIAIAKARIEHHGAEVEVLGKIEPLAPKE